MNELNFIEGKIDKNKFEGQNEQMKYYIKIEMGSKYTERKIIYEDFFSDSLDDDHKLLIRYFSEEIESLNEEIHKK